MIRVFEVYHGLSILLVHTYIKQYLSTSLISRIIAYFIYTSGKFRDICCKYMSFEIFLHPCLECGKIIKKRMYESYNRNVNRKYCSDVCTKKYLSREKVGWFSNLNTIKMRLGNEKKKADPIDEIAPIIEDKSYFEKFDRDYGALLSGLES